MWVRGIIGLAVCAVGVVWILQGLSVLHGSTMSGHVLYAALGAVAAVLGAGLLGQAVRVRRRSAKSANAS
jgi:uncharacterized membrane protein HdeD (DUF308 family)